MPDSASAKDSLASALARLTALEHERAIRLLASDYCHGFDRREFQRFRGVWHEDAVWVPYPGQEIQGADAILAQAERMWQSLSASFHWTANHVVQIDGDVALGEADVDVLVCIDGSWVQAPGMYIDRYERRDGIWLIARRDASHEHQAFLSLPLRDDESPG